MPSARAARVQKPLFVAAALAVTACASLITIPLEYEGQTTIPAGTVVDTLLGDLGFDELIALDVAASQEIADANADPGDIVSVSLTEFSLRVVEPDGADLGFLQSIEVFVTAPGSERVRVASGSNFDGKTVAFLELDDVDLVDHVIAGPLTVDLTVSGSRPDEATTISASVGLAVALTTQGACKAIGGEDPQS